MSDSDLREAERRWLAAPDDAGARSRAVHEFRRAGRDLPFGLIVGLDRWRRVVDFIADWDERPLGPGEGYPPSELDATERRIGRPLPIAVREWFLIAGPGFAGSERTTLPPDAVLLGNGLLLFAQDERLANLAWEIEVEKGGEDPPVRVGRVDEDHWTQEYDSLTEFLYARLVHAAIGGDLGTTPNGITELSSASLDLLKSTYARLPVPVSHWPVPMAFFGDGETLLAVNEDPYLRFVTATARTPEAWARIDAFVKEHSHRGDWLHAGTGSIY